MRRATTAVWSIFALVWLAGCTVKPIPLTAQLRRDHSLGPEQLRRLQLFVSHEVRLKREADRTDRRIDGGALRLRSGKSVDEVVIHERTPCVATEVRGDAITVAFEDGSTLEFELASRSENPPTRSGALRVEPDFAEAPTGPYLAMPPARTSSETIGGYWLVAREGQARYRGLEWQAIGESLRAQLLVRTEELTDVEETRTVVGGRTL